MRTYATAQHIGTRSRQCDATAVQDTPDGTRIYVLLDGIGSTPQVRYWARTNARRLAAHAAHHRDAEAGLRSLYNHYAAKPARRDPFTRHDPPSAAAIVAVETPGKPLTIAWCGDSRAYLLANGRCRRLTEDHNLRRASATGRGNRNLITSYLGGCDSDEELQRAIGHPAIESISIDAAGSRLLLASDGAYEPLEDSARDLSLYLTGTPQYAADDIVASAIDHATAHADNATALVADITS